MHILLFLRAWGGRPTPVRRWRCFMRVGRAKDPFGALLAATITGGIMVNVVFNISKYDYLKC